MDICKVDNEASVISVVCLYKSVKTYCFHPHTHYFIKWTWFLRSLRGVKSSCVSREHSQTIFKSKQKHLYSWFIFEGKPVYNSSLWQKLLFSVYTLVLPCAPALRQITGMIMCPAGPLCSSLPLSIPMIIYSIHTPPTLCLCTWPFYTLRHCSHTIKRTPMTCDIMGAQMEM